MEYKIDEKTQKMLTDISIAKANLEMQMKIIFQVLLNNVGAPPDAKVTIAQDFSSMNVEIVKPPTPEEGKVGNA